MVRNMIILMNKLLLLALMLFGTASCKEDAPDKTVYVESIEVKGKDITEGKYSQMEVMVSPEDADDPSVTWETSNPEIAEISQGGLVTAINNGKVTITATAKDRLKVKGEKEIVITSFEEEKEETGGVAVETVRDLYTALAEAQAGDTVYIKAGTYKLSNRIELETSGTAEKNIVVIGNAGEGRALLDFSAMEESSSNKGIILKADFWYIKGFDIYHAGDNGMQITGSNNLIEFCTFSSCADSGLQLDNGASHNTILNCDSYFNADSKVENADGFACKLSVGSGNTFIGCRAWNNLDDGWDGYLRETDNVNTTYENCWAIKNGYGEGDVLGGGDGNGFKTGGSDDKQLKHNATYTRCIAIGNASDGFDHNSNRGEVTLLNCSAYDNGRNLAFSNENSLAKLTIKNSAVLGALGKINAIEEDVSHNSWMDGISTTEGDFKSLDISQLTGPRQADGSLPEITFMHLVSGSDLIDKGVDVGLPFNGAAPDLGAFER